MLAHLQIVLEYHSAFSTSLFNAAFLPAYSDRILSFEPESQF